MSTFLHIVELNAASSPGGRFMLHAARTPDKGAALRFVLCGMQDVMEILVLAGKTVNRFASGFNRNAGTDGTGFSSHNDAPNTPAPRRNPLIGGIGSANATFGIESGRISATKGEQQQGMRPWTSNIPNLFNFNNDEYADDGAALRAAHGCQSRWRRWTRQRT